MKDLSNKHINANYRKGAQTYIGSLWFYDDGFEYKAKSVISDIALGKILYSEISSIKPANTLGIVPNSIKIKLKNNKEYIYVVNNRKSVLTFLQSKLR